jgi:DNA-binding transcriptional MocR family regulator
MEWAKTRAAARYDLAGSNLEACALGDLPGARDALDIAGESPDGFPPLVAAIAQHSKTVPERVATASGCSGANFLAMAAMVKAGDEVLMESPGYDPLPAAARLLGATVRTFERRFEEGYAIDPRRVAAAIHNLFDNLYVHGMNVHVGLLLGFIAAAGEASAPWGGRAAPPSESHSRAGDADA